MPVVDAAAIVWEGVNIVEDFGGMYQHFQDCDCPDCGSDGHCSKLLS